MRIYSCARVNYRSISTVSHLYIQQQQQQQRWWWWWQSQQWLWLYNELGTKTRHIRLRARVCGWWWLTNKLTTSPSSTFICTVASSTPKCFLYNWWTILRICFFFNLYFLYSSIEIAVMKRSAQNGFDDYLFLLQHRTRDPPLSSLLLFRWCH